MDEKDKHSSTLSAAYLEQIISDATLGKEGFTGIKPPVCINIHSVRKRLTDAEGISAKAIIDAIINAQVLPDDSPQYVKRVTFSQEKGRIEYTTITIEEMINVQAET